MSVITEALAFPRHAVTAVIVAHDGARWLPGAINGLRGQTRPVQQLVAVDTGSKDGSAELLTEAFGVDAVIPRKRNVGFGAAVAYAVNACERIDHAAFANSVGLDLQPRPSAAAGYVRGGGRGPAGAPLTWRQGEGEADYDADPDSGGARRQTPGDRYRQRHGLDADGYQTDDDWTPGAADFAGPAGAAEPGGVVEWIWLLHDDCEPAPEALWHLLAVAEMNRSAAVIGPKVRSWFDQRQLLEVGVTIAASGGRWTGLERREQDQGQHDQVRDVLAVGSAGMLVRRDVWDELQGFDRALALMRDDVDFCWRARMAGHRVLVAPEAVVRHAEAASHERRRVHATVDRPHLVDRAHSIYVLLANLPARQLPWAFLRLVLATLVRSAAYLVGKLPGLASDEFFGLLAALSRPDRLMRGRRQRARTRTVDVRELRELFPPRWSGARYVLERGYARFARSGQSADPYGGRHRAIETGPGADDAEDLDADSLMWLRRLLRRPGFLLVIGLLVLTGVASRALLTGGRLAGGALLPAPTGAGDLWSAYLNGWHTVSFGSPNDAPPYLAVLALLATVLLGHASLAVSALILGCVPLAGLTAYVAAGRLVASRLLRVWAALAYALLPAATGAVSGGRLGSVVAIVLLPLLGIGTASALGGHGRSSPTRAAWATGFGLAVASAFVPFAWVLMAAVGLVAVVATGSGARGAGRLLIILAVPVATLLPWSLTLVRHPASLLIEVGATAGLSGRPSGLDLAMANPGGPGTFPALIAVGVVLAAVGALLRIDRRRALVAGWAAAAVGLIAALLVNRVDVRGPGMSDPIHVWPGVATALMGAGLIVAALIGSEDLRDRVAASSFGWRQPVALLVAVSAGVFPVLAMGMWVVRGADGPVRRQDPTQVPAYVAAEAQTPSRPRTLALRTDADGAVSFALLRDSGATLGAEELKPTRVAASQLDAAVASVLSGKGGGETAQLGLYGVRYVLAVAPVRPDLVQTLDGVPGLVRVSEQDGSFMWQNAAPSARLRLVSGGVQGITSQDVASTGAIGTTTNIPAGASGRQLLLAEQADTHWHATLNGQLLDGRSANGWQQAFAVPAAGGGLKLWYDNSDRTIWVAVEAALAVVALVMALPSGRRREDEDELGPAAVAVDDAPPLAAYASAEPEATPAADGAGPGRRGRRGRRDVPIPRRRRRGARPSAEAPAAEAVERDALAPEADDWTVTDRQDEYDPFADEADPFPDHTYRDGLFSEQPHDDPMRPPSPEELFPEQRHPDEAFSDEPYYPDRPEASTYGYQPHDYGDDGYRPAPPHSHRPDPDPSGRRHAADDESGPHDPWSHQ